MCACMLSPFSCVQLFATLRTIHSLPGVVPWPPSGDLPHQRIEPTSPESLALIGRLFTTSTTWEAFSIKCSYLSLIFSSLLFYYINDFIKYLLFYLVKYQVVYYIQSFS